MNIATFTHESALNRKAYSNLRARIRSEYAGRYVAFGHGKILGAAATFDEARAIAERLQPAPEYYLVFLAESEPDFELAYDLAGMV